VEVLKIKKRDILDRKENKESAGKTQREG